MFADTFYHGLIRKYVTLFGTLFNDVYVNRPDTAGGVINTVKVPLARTIQIRGFRATLKPAPIPMAFFVQAIAPCPIYLQGMHLQLISDKVLI